MFIEFLISMFGIVVVHRILSLLEKFEVISAISFKYFFILLQFPLFLHLIFKELTEPVIIYIGIILIILILSPKIIQKYYRFSFERLHLSILQRVIIYVSTGQSCKTSLKNVWHELSNKDKATFAPLLAVLETDNLKTDKNRTYNNYFYDEIAQIMHSKSHILNQLLSFRRILSLQHNLRHKSRQCTLQIRAQVAVCIVLYIFILFLSVSFLKLEFFSWLTWASFLLQVGGLYLVFSNEKRIKWKT